MPTEWGGVIADGTTQDWTNTGWTRINEEVTPPTVPSGGDESRVYAEDKGDRNDVEEYKLKSLPVVAGGTATLVTLWLYVTDSDDNIFSVDLQVDGVWQGAQSPVASGGWTSFDFVISEALDTEKTLFMRMTQSGFIDEMETGDKVGAPRRLVTYTGGGGGGGGGGVPGAISAVIGMRRAGS